MTIFSGFNTTASALTANRLRMDVVASNMANAESTRGTLVNGEWQPYRRKMVMLQPNQPNFNSFLNKAMNSSNPGEGVKVSKIVDDQTPFKLVYDPFHPDANDQGYVQMPNVDPLREMVDLMSATRSYEANVTALNATKNMLLKALEIGR
ncbi:flagellar basal body rod protein FlgC [Bacillus alkalicellulosilyticus]|uniref:flagellar basal body rod protein FlgC n=1 Tax=Alkalihalobacterium alkalicellulosilyticum TaxID=1912214 RepID=UPI0014823DFB|nr:flagellar basal body rod protein FlgC [Bacillus alkalicellulosilyticus]